MANRMASCTQMVKCRGIVRNTKLGLTLLLTLTELGRALGAGQWAFQPVVRPPVPELRGWRSSTRNPIDAFICVKLSERGLALSSEADRRLLIRRLSFDLRGLPPTPEEVDAFLADGRADAYDRVVERFLAAPQYGERWGRHWLDIAAYADSNGYFSADSDRPLAWKYRDFVIRSLNADKPFDRFIQEQIAGDELAGYTSGGDVTPEMVDPLIATHFWRNAPDGTGESDGNPLEVKVDRYSVIEGDVQLLGSAFLGLTFQCARCHNHKFEPVTQEEYYALQAIIRPAFDPDRWLKPNERTVAIGPRAAREKNERDLAEHERALRTLKEGLEGLAAPFRKQLLEENLLKLDATSRKALQQAFDTKEKDRSDAMKALLKANAALVEIDEAALAKRFTEFASTFQLLREAIQRRESSAPTPLEKISVLAEPTNAPSVHHLLLRGNHAQEGKEIGPGVPAVLLMNSLAGLHYGVNEVPVRGIFPVEGQGEGRRGEREKTDVSYVSAHGRMPTTTGRRLALARWLTSPDNPIVPRVLVNRAWSYHFGQGLVATLDNFGQSGARPTHPELLDWLASEFIRSGWSLKHLNRLIVTSATYRQSAAVALVKAASDSPPNAKAKDSHASSSPKPSAQEGASSSALYAGFSSIRLDAESIRDAMLAVSGELDLRLGGPYVPTKLDNEGQVIIDEQNVGAKRRSLYLQQRRTAPVNLLATFDGPAHNPVCIQRVQSTVALQSLSLLNSDFIRARARAFARRILRTADFSPAQVEHSDVRRKEQTSALDLAFELAYCRPPKGDELTAAQNFLQTQAAAYLEKPDAAECVWTDLCQMLLASNQFLYVD